MLTTMQRLQLNGELSKAIVVRNAEKNALKKLGLIKVVQELRQKLGLLNTTISSITEHNKHKTEAENPAHKSQAKRDTSVFYTYEEKRTKGQRQKANNAAVKLLKEFNSGKRTIESLTDDDREILAKYTGSGGNLITADGKKGSSYEYYTPKPIAQAAWSLMQEMGFNGGKVLDPCAGVGIFGATSPQNAVMDAVELDSVSGGINQLVNQGLGSHVTVCAFEKIAASTPGNP